jgi:predicted small metal-binding protein
MSKVINCECGEVIRATSDDELVEKVEQHVGKAHPELAGKMSRDDVLAMGRKPENLQSNEHEVAGPGRARTLRRPR